MKNITAETSLTRIDLQDSWDNKTNSLEDWYQYIISTYHQEEHITDDEYDQLIKVKDVEKWFEELCSYAEFWEFDFVDKKGNSVVR